MLITGLLVCLRFCFFILLAEPAGYLYNNNFFNKYQEHGGNHRAVGRFAHALGSFFGRVIALVAAHNTYGKTKHDRFDKRCHKINKGKRLKHLLYKGAPAGAFVCAYV
jgi:hypothetical protein